MLSSKNKPLYNYFKQLFAQVTNPPIDPIRENIVMSLNSFIGPKPDLLDINAINPPMRLEVHQPVLDFDDMARLRSIAGPTNGKFKPSELDITYPAAWGKGWRRGPPGVAVRLGRGCHQDRPQHPHHHDRHVSSGPRGHPRAAGPVGRAPPPVREGLRTTAGLVVETGTAREVHHFAVLAGYGAEAVHPYLALETLEAMKDELPASLSVEKAIYNYIKAVGKGLSKIMSKMGISTYMSYCGAQIFEAIGLKTDFVEKYFRGTPTKSAASACSRWPRKPFACTSRCLRQRPAAREHARCWRRVRLAYARRRTHVDAGRHCSCSTGARRQVRHLQGLRPDHQRPEQAPHDAARSVRVQVRPPRPCRWTRSSQPPRSSSASPRVPCRSVPSRPKPTPRWLLP